MHNLRVGIPRRGMQATFMLFLSFLGLSFHSLAQSASVSPYSLFGHGLMQQNAFSYHGILGGTQAASTSRLYVNPDQPASYADIQFTTLDLGGAYTGVHQSTANASLWNTTGGFKNMGVAFPLKKWMGFSAGIMPYSVVGYDMLTMGSNADFGDFTEQFKGKGGYNKAHFGIGVKPFKFFSFGVNAQYIFGSMDQSTDLIFSDNQFNAVKLSQRTLVSDWMWNGGAQLRVPIGNLRAVIGLTVRQGAALSSHYDQVNYTYILGGVGSETPLDTNSSNLNEPGYIFVPTQMAIGFELSKPVKDLPISAWAIGMQIQATDQLFLLPFTTGPLPWTLPGAWSGPYTENGQRISLSASLIPSLTFTEKRLKSYGAEVAYRASFAFERTGLVLNGTPISTWQGNFGVGLPLGGRAMLPGDVKFATLHIGAQVGQWGTTKNNLIQEFYTQAVIGVTLNDQWFVKFKYR
jgi:hypothetical protein